MAAGVALPWVVPGVPAAFTAAYDAIVQPAAPTAKPATRSVPVAGLAKDAYDTVLAIIEPGAAPPRYLEGELASAGEPRRVRVPRLGLDAPVVPISGQGGVLVPPDDARLLGWWQEGARAGDPQGAAVVTGHTVHTGGGALDTLGTLRRGDTFSVQTAAGAITYLVRWQHDYPTTELARRAARLFGQADYPRLLLITCSGWNGSGYDRNAVVLARPVAERPARQSLQ